MSVNVVMRNVPDTPSNERCLAVESALNLCLHTIKICKNRNIFTVEYIDIVSLATQYSIDVYTCVFTANNIRVTDGKSKEKRLEYEKESLYILNSLLGIIEISQRLFHLRMKKKENWVRLALNAKSLISKWYQSEKERYKDVS